MPAARKRKSVEYGESEEEEEQDIIVKKIRQDEEIISNSSFQPSTITIPRPKNGPFADALSSDSLQFLAELSENNDRDFMRVKSKEWEKVRKDFTDFAGLLMTEIHQVDPSVRVEEAKQTVYRQHRDLRFTNDKRPYKTYLSASFSRQGRKFQDAGYYISIEPNDRSMIGVGIWQPDKNRMSNLRASIIRNGDLLREALSTEAIQEVFEKTGREILSEEDKLKVAPKNIAKDHPEIELLRYKSFVVTKYFSDQDVVSEGFLEKVMDVIEALVPFVAVLNSWV
ncbi:hypothetical protein G6F56_010802 [Rhizopus delemar]|nr:hypothetical protein G6F56_010802 [Rhizopus delemar]